MADSGANLGLTYGWAERESGWKDAMDLNLFLLDALTQLAVLDKTLTSPPGAPSHGDRYIIPAGAGGAWSGRTNEIAIWRDDSTESGAWVFVTPGEGWLAFVIDEDEYYYYHSGAWGITGVVT